MTEREATIVIQLLFGPATSSGGLSDWAPPAFSAWHQVDGSLPHDVSIVRLQSNVPCQVMLGVGPSGAEKNLATVRLQPWDRPAQILVFRQVSKGDRLSIRADAMATVEVTIAYCWMV